MTQSTNKSHSGSTRNPSVVASSEKAAIVALAMGDDFAHQLMAACNDHEREVLTIALAKRKMSAASESTPVVEEFNLLLRTYENVNAGGIAYAEKLLVDTVGEVRAKEILKRIKRDIEETGFAKLRKADPEQLRAVLAGELPQAIALIVAHMDARTAAAMLGGFSSQQAADILYRMAVMEKVSPHVLETIEAALGDGVLANAGQMSKAGGPEYVAEVLNATPASHERELMDLLYQINSQVADSIKEKMFVFEDILRLDDGSLAKVLRQVEEQSLIVALKGASEEIMERVRGSLARSAWEQLHESMEDMGPVRAREVDAAKGVVVAKVLELAEEGEIMLSLGGGDDDEIVY